MTVVDWGKEKLVTDLIPADEITIHISGKRNYHSIYRARISNSEETSVVFNTLKTNQH